MQNKIEMAGRIPYDEAVPKLLARKRFIIDFKDNPAAAAVIQLWGRLKNDFYG
jgi:MinD superfamily P-loop ATPase